MTTVGLCYVLYFGFSVRSSLQTHLQCLISEATHKDYGQRLEVKALKLNQGLKLEKNGSNKAT